MGNISTKRTTILPVGSLYETVDCDSDAAVGDWVILKDQESLFAEVLSDNRNDQLPLGVIIRKNEATRATVQTHGPCELDFTGIAKGPVVLSIAGQASNNTPNDGYIYWLGNCFHNKKIYININPTKLKRNPF